MRRCDGIVRWTVRLAFLALVAGVAMSFREALKPIPAPAVKSPGKDARREDELCAGLFLTQRFGSGERVSVGRIATSRIRRGPFSFAAREMVIEQLALTLPDSYFRPPEPQSAPEAVSAPGSASPAPAARPHVPSGLDVLMNDSPLKTMFPNVAGLTIRGLMIDRLEGGTNAVHWLRAAQGAVKEGGLALQKGASIENGVLTTWKRGFLVLKPFLRLYHD